MCAGCRQIICAEEEESRHQLERDNEELRAETAALETEAAHLRLETGRLGEELARLRRSMASEVEEQRSRHNTRLEQILEELAGSTLRFSRYTRFLSDQE